MVSLRESDCRRLENEYSFTRENHRDGERTICKKANLEKRGF